jgi:hypothetical protein
MQQKELVDYIAKSLVMIRSGGGARDEGEQGTILELEWLRMTLVKLLVSRAYRRPYVRFWRGVAKTKKRAVLEILE